MDRLTTPEERFDRVADFDLPVTRVEVTDPTGGAPLTMAMVDTGAGSSGETVLLLHGEPSWSFLYRKVVPALVAAGHRVVAPTSSGSAAPTSPPTAPSTPTRATSSGCARGSSTAPG